MLSKRARTSAIIATAIMLLLLLLAARIAALSDWKGDTAAVRAQPASVQPARLEPVPEAPRTWHQAYASVADRHPDKLLEVFASTPLTRIGTDDDAEPEAIEIVPVAPPVAVAAEIARQEPVETESAVVAQARAADALQTEAESPPAAQPEVAAVPLQPLENYSSRRPQTIRIANRQPEQAVAEPARVEAQPVTRYQRLDANGEPVAGDQPWSCVRDNRSDLVWEVKTSDGGLRDAGFLYSWFDPSVDGRSGVSDGGRCGGGIDCDTHAYQVALNRQALCGFDDWRLPSKQELQTLVALDRQDGDATIDRDYFPAATPSWYWTASSNEMRPGYAWYVLFRNGIPLNDLKARPKHIRLVRGNRMLLASNK